ncbi:Histone-lysine N-methyltransferase [Coemansia sp. RSA 2049]|nr:Histone-lysine N-methyltransferase [Coemansia sp. RSA 2049]
MSTIDQDSYDTIATDEFLSETDIIESAELSAAKKRDQLSQRFARTASSGDAGALERMWASCHGEQWIDIDHRDDQGSTPLICASCFGHAHIAELLLKYGAKVDTQDNSGWTALMWATTNQNEDLVRVLLENGASSSAKTARGHTAINIASSSLSAGSDSESIQRGSESPSPQSEATDFGGGTHERKGSEASSMKASVNDGDSGSVSTSSPQSTSHSVVGTPSRRRNGRDSITAGHNVLSMLQASSARSSNTSKQSDGSDAQSASLENRSLSPTSRLASGNSTVSEGLGLTLDGSGEHGEDAGGGYSMSPEAASSLSGRMDALGVGGSNSAGHFSNSTNRDSMYGSAEDNTAAKADYDGYNDNSGYGNNRRKLDNRNAGEEEDDDDDDHTKEPHAFDWDTLHLDQMFVISPAAVPQFLHSVVKDIQPERWIHINAHAEYKFVPASMIFLAARFAHHLGTPDFLGSFLADSIASIIHEVQTHKADPVALAFWISNIQTLIYFFKRDATLVQTTSDAQGRMSECIQDAYSLLVRAIEAEMEPLIDASLLAHDSMPELFADVKFEVEKSQRLSMFFFGNQADANRKSADGRPLRRSQTVLQRGGGRPRRSSILGGVSGPKQADNGPSTAGGEPPAWILCVEQLVQGLAPVQESKKGALSDSVENTYRKSSSAKRPSSGDTFVSGKLSQEGRRQSTSISRLVTAPSPRTITYMLDRLLGLLELCEIHPQIVWSIMRQIFCYLGSETFNRVLTTRDFCSRSRAMQIRMNLTQLSDWVCANSSRLRVPSAANQQSVSPNSANATNAKSVETLLYKTYFGPVVELLELLQCLTHLPELSEYFETTAKMQSLNILQQETAVANYRYEVQEERVAPEVVEYLGSVAKEIRESQRAEKEKQSIERASRRSTASVFTERRTLDGRPNLLSFDMTSSCSRGASVGGLLRIAATVNDSAGASTAGQGSDWNSSHESSQPVPIARLSAESSGGPSPPLQSQSSGVIAISGASGTIGSTRGRAGTRSGRRGLLLPLARPGTSASAKPSVRTLFPGNAGGGPSPTGQSHSGGRTSSTHSRLSENLEPISETSSIVSRQRSRTTIDSLDADMEISPTVANSTVGTSAGNSGNGDGYDGIDYHAQQQQQQQRQKHMSLPPNTAPATHSSGWGDDDSILTASLRGPKGKKCLPEEMSELLDSSEMLPFAVPTSREWLAWWQNRNASGAATAAVASEGKTCTDLRSHNRDWSNETVAYHSGKTNLQSVQDPAGTAPDGNAASRDRRSSQAGSAAHIELAPAVPSEFLNALLQSA